MKFKELVEVAKNMNEALGLEPPIKTIAISIDALTEAIKAEATKEIRTEEWPTEKLLTDDGEEATVNLTSATWTALKELTNYDAEPASDAGAAEAGEGEALPPPAKEKAPKASKEETAPPAPRKVRESKYSRISASIDAIKGKSKGLTAEAWAEKASALFVKAGGKDNKKQALHVILAAVAPVLVYAGLLAVTDKLYSWAEN